MERIKYKGRPASAGTCRGCNKILIVTDIDAQRTFSTYHEDPLCEWYKKNCEAAEPTAPEWVKLADVITIEGKPSVNTKGEHE